MVEENHRGAEAQRYEGGEGRRRKRRRRRRRRRRRNGVGSCTGGPRSRTSGPGSCAGGFGSCTGGVGSCTGGHGSCTRRPGSCAGGFGSCTGGVGSCTGGHGSCTRRPGSCTCGPGSCTCGFRSCTGGPGPCTGGLRYPTREIGAEMKEKEGRMSELAAIDGTSSLVSLSFSPHASRQAHGLATSLRFARILSSFNIPSFPSLRLLCASVSLRFSSTRQRTASFANRVRAGGRKDKQGRGQNKSSPWSAS
jgi:hypothetical protein